MNAVSPRVSGEGEAASAAAVLVAIASPIVVVDRELRVGFANPAAEDLLGSSIDQLRGLTLAEAVGADSPLAALVARAQARATVVVERAAELDMAGGRGRFELQAAPIEDGSQAIVILVGGPGIAAGLDGPDGPGKHPGLATSIGAMSAMLAHEIKNPLAGVRGAAQLLEPGLGTDDRSLTRLIRDECDRICDLVDRMDAMAGLTLSRRAVNIHAVLDRVLGLARSGFAAGIDFVAAYDPSLPPAFGDHDQLVQVFLNLVKNAVAALPDRGGRVTIATRYRHDVRVGGREGMRVPLEVAVRDNGGGIPAEIRPCIFDPFVTTRSGGTGLGLALVAKVVDEHGGSVDFTSDGTGTEFRVRLPAAEGGRREAPGAL